MTPLILNRYYNVADIMAINTGGKLPLALYQKPHRGTDARGCVFLSLREAYLTLYTGPFVLVVVQAFSRRSYFPGDSSC